MPRTCFVILFALTVATTCAAAQVEYQMDCDLGKGTTQTQRANGFTIVLTPSNGMCHVSVLEADRKSIFTYSSTGVQVFVGIGVTTKDGPTAVIQADDFNAYKLFVISLGAHPRLVRTIENQYGFWLQNDCGGRVRIWTSDGAFDADPDLKDVYHQDLFTPDVVFEVEGEKLVDATPVCSAYFDGEIGSLRSKLTERDVQRFRNRQIKDDFYRGEVRGSILKIIFSYLYSGRETEAKQFLQQMWPTDDRDRLWRSILKLRSEGVLRNLNNSH